jgi:hypothetical protein
MACGSLRRCVQFFFTTQKYINYTIYTNDIPISTIEASLQNLTVLSASLESTNPQCVDDFYRFECSQMYAKCTTTSTGTYAQTALVAILKLDKFVIFLIGSGSCARYDRVASSMPVHLCASDSDLRRRPNSYWVQIPVTQLLANLTNIQQSSSKR